MRNANYTRRDFLVDASAALDAVSPSVRDVTITVTVAVTTNLPDAEVAALVETAIRDAALVRELVNA